MNDIENKKVYKKQKKGKKVKNKPFVERHNPKAFTFSGGHVSVHRRVQRTAEIEEKRVKYSHSIDKENGSAPFIVVVHGPAKSGKTTLIKSLIKYYTKQSIGEIRGPVTVVTSKNRRLTFFEANSNFECQIDLAKIADLAIVMIDIQKGIEKSTFEFINLLKIHGFPRIIGVLSFIDTMRNNKQLSKIKKKLKKRFWADLYDGAKLFYLTGIKNKKYLQREIINLSRFISVQKFEPLIWKSNHPYIVALSVRLITEESEPNSLEVLGYLKGSCLNQNQIFCIPGCLNFNLASISIMPDPCPLPKNDASLNNKHKLDQTARLCYAPSSQIGATEFEGDSMYITLKNNIDDKEQEFENDQSIVSELSDDNSLTDWSIDELDSDIEDVESQNTNIYQANSNNEEGCSSNNEANLEENNLNIGKIWDDEDNDSQSDTYDISNNADDQFEKLNKMFTPNSTNNNINYEHIIYSSQYKEYVSKYLTSSMTEKIIEMDELISDKIPELDLTCDLVDSTMWPNEYLFNNLLELTKLQFVLHKNNDVNNGINKLEDINYELDFFSPSSDTYNTDTEVINEDNNMLIESSFEAKLDNVINDCSISNCTKTSNKQSNTYVKIDDSFHLNDNLNDSSLSMDINKNMNSNNDASNVTNDNNCSAMFIDNNFVKIESINKDEINTTIYVNSTETEAEGTPNVDNFSMAACSIIKSMYFLTGGWETGLCEELQHLIVQIIDETIQKKIGNNNFDNLVESINPGTFVKIVIDKLDSNWVEQLTKSNLLHRPLILGGISSTENVLTFINCKVIKHRWAPHLLKSTEPLIFSTGWHRFQSIPYFCIEDRKETRLRYLKYTPEHLHCQMVIYGFATNPNTGIVGFKYIDSSIIDWKISLSGSVLQNTADPKIYKKIKLLGDVVQAKLNFCIVKNMFQNAFEVNRCLGVKIQTQSSIRGIIKKAIGNDGAFRATFEAKVNMNDTIICKAWAQVPLEPFCLPVNDIQSWDHLRTFAQIRREDQIFKNDAKISESSYKYKEIGRKQKLAKLKISSKLIQELPYKSIPKVQLDSVIGDEKLIVAMTKYEKMVDTIITKAKHAEQQKIKKDKAKLREKIAINEKQSRANRAITYRDATNPKKIKKNIMIKKNILQKKRS